MTSHQDQHAGGAAGSGDAAERDRAIGDLRQPAPQEFDIRIAADGSWYHAGGLIGRPALVRLFSTVLRREDDGSYWLVTPVERGRIGERAATRRLFALRKDEGVDQPAQPDERPRRIIESAPRCVCCVSFFRSFCCSLVFVFAFSVSIFVG